MRVVVDIFSRRGVSGYVAALGTEIDLEPAISVIAERAQTLTGASGAAIALRKGDEMVCRARAGRTAPDLGVRLQSDSGISADCIRTGEVVLCHDAEKNPQVDLAACQRLGVRSILAAPLRHFRRTLGVFEVFSAPRTRLPPATSPQCNFFPASWWRQSPAFRVPTINSDRPPKPLLIRGLAPREGGVLRCYPSGLICN